VKDLDDLREKHIEKTYDTSKGWSIDEVKYQKFIDDFITPFSLKIGTLNYLVFSSYLFIKSLACINK